MLAFIIRKILYALLVLVGVVVVTFFIRPPGNPARVLLGQRADSASVAALEAQLGLDKSVPEQMGRYMSNLVFEGDMGRSISTNEPVREIIGERIFASALLATTSMAAATLFGIMIGLLAAYKPNSWLDTGLMSTALLGISVPSFVAGLMFIIVFGVQLEWFPNSGYIDRGIEHLFLPFLTLAIRPMAVIARITRAGMLDVLGQDYVRTARAKGLSTYKVYVKHALRNALNPVVTTVGAWFSALLAGAFFIEVVFYWPGIGLAAMSGIEKIDYPVIQGMVLLSAAIFVVVNLLTDLLYAYIDPKVRLS